MTPKISPPGCPSSIDGAGSVSEVKEAGAQSEAGREVSSAESTEAPSAGSNDPVIAAMRDVVTKYHAGATPDLDSAIQAVVDRLVEIRFSQLSVETRSRMATSLNRMLGDDPRFVAMVEQMLVQVQ